MGLYEDGGRTAPDQEAFLSAPRQNVEAKPITDQWLIKPHHIIRAFLSQMRIIDPDLLAHSRSVVRYSLLMGKGLEFTQEDMRKVCYSALLHDLGMMTINRQIIEKGGRLEPNEWKLIQAHPANAEKILSALPCFADIIPIIRHHHERYNGMGYPDNLEGESIPFIARVLSIGDVFDAMIHNRSYREALGINEALRIIEEDAGRQFDPKLTSLFATVVFDDIKRRRSKDDERKRKIRVGFM